MERLLKISLAETTFCSNRLQETAGAEVGDACRYVMSGCCPNRGNETPRHPMAFEPSTELAAIALGIMTIDEDHFAIYTAGTSAATASVGALLSASVNHGACAASALPQADFPRSGRSTRRSQPAFTMEKPKRHVFYHLVGVYNRKQRELVLRQRRPSASHLVGETGLKALSKTKLLVGGRGMAIGAISGIACVENPCDDPARPTGSIVVSDGTLKSGEETAKPCRSMIWWRFCQEAGCGSSDAVPRLGAARKINTPALPDRFFLSQGRILAPIRSAEFASLGDWNRPVAVQIARASNRLLRSATAQR